MPESQAPIHLGMFRVMLSKDAKRRLRSKFTTDTTVARIINGGMGSLTLEEFAIINPLLKSTCVSYSRSAAWIYMVGE